LTKSRNVIIYFVSAEILTGIFYIAALYKKMARSINIENNPEFLNQWIRKSLELFQNTNYLDQILEVYPFQIAVPERLDASVRRNIIAAHSSRRTEDLINLLRGLTKFPYDEPIWFLIKNIENCALANPRQIHRIAETLYAMSAEETVLRLEAAPKLNTQMGPMFTGWLRRRFNLLHQEAFEASTQGICILDVSEEIGRIYINTILHQNLDKRPDLIAKVNNQIIIGEAKWIGQSGGNQEKQVKEVVNFCKDQRGAIRRIGIVDGYPWSTYNTNHRMINDKVVVNIQESEYDILSSLLLEEYLQQFL